MKRPPRVEDDPFDLAGQHLDLDFVIRTVTKHREKMLQKPKIYDRNGKALNTTVRWLEKRVGNLKF